MAAHRERRARQARAAQADRKAERKPDNKPEVGRDQTLRLKEGAGKPKHGKKPFRKGARPAGGGRGGKGGGFGGAATASPQRRFRKAGTKPALRRCAEAPPS